MPDNPTLLAELASRAKSFHADTGISRAQMATAIGMADGNYSAFLSGRKGNGAEATCLLLKFIAMSKREGIAKFSKPAPTSKILHLQRSSAMNPEVDTQYPPQQNDIRKMRLATNDGWVAQEGSTDDPVNSTTIDNAPDAATAGPVWNEDLIDTLRESRGYHRLIIRAISSYIQNAKTNRD
jgi:hypothetical protein